jgi:streptogramin lyase
MKATPLSTVLACLATLSATAADYSYVVLNSSDRNSLVRLAPDGTFLATIANGAGGHGMTKDGSGNYIVAAVGSLRKVTPSGGVSTIAKAPSGSQWMSVVLDAAGDFIVADNRQHCVWRVSQSGESITKLVDYPANLHILNNTSIVLDGKGNYLLLADADCRLDKITPTGELSPIRLNRKMRFCGSLVPDGPGAYLAVREKGESIVRLTDTGEVTEIAQSSPPHANVTGVVRDPETGEFISVVNFEHSFLRTSANGQTTIVLASDTTYLPYPTAILVETAR